MHDAAIGGRHTEDFRRAEYFLVVVDGCGCAVDDEVGFAQDFELEAEDLPIAQRSLADPWKRAKLVTVEPGKAKNVQDLSLPQK